MELASCKMCHMTLQRQSHDLKSSHMTLPCQSHDYHTTHLEDLKAGNVEDSDEGGLRAESAVQRLVDPLHDPLEQALVECLGQRLTGELRLWRSV